ncbi:MAG: hypothetical protein A2V66_04620 [Ignavibacteria bacterium RBG_13_36_8]|nr:MAG: hypothetical protein A2V66_04620 [Ignavibacteria bacterium RBG_13_36_8]
MKGISTINVDFMTNFIDIFLMRVVPVIKKFPFNGWIGLLLVILFWSLNWLLGGLRTHLLFFPLWLGYCLTIDALVFLRKGNSLLTRNWKAYASLFIISAPSWWLFEMLNSFTQNWQYLGREHFTQLEYSLLETLSFTTVVPAVFGTAEFASTFKWIKNLKRGIKIEPSSKTLLIFLVLGWGMLALLIILPEYFFPFMWLSVYFILEPVNVWLKNKSLLEYTAKGDWHPIISLWIGCLICGFFWEMWNYFSYPKWIYEVPFVNFMHIFEMPLLGYLGYLPFSLELFAMYQLVIKLFPERFKCELGIFNQ